MTSTGIETTETAIRTGGLTKRFGSHLAVDDVNLSVPAGSVFGFLGPNGSGKTTTIRMLLGLAAATSGEVSILGQSMPQNLAAVLPSVGALVEGPGFYPYLSGAANLDRLDTADRFAPSLSRRTRVEQALERVGLEHAAGKKVKAYSLGMKQRLGIANALLAPRELLILDEPTNGLDPQGTREVRNLVRSLAAEGTTVFVSSHLLAEIEQICTHAAVMSAGRLVAQGTLEELRGDERGRVRLSTPDAADAIEVFHRLGMTAERRNSDGSGQQHSEDAGNRAEAVIATPAEVDKEVDKEVDRKIDRAIEPARIVAALVAAGVRVNGFTVETQSLEERFVALTGEGFDVVR